MTDKEKLTILATLEAYTRKCRNTLNNHRLDDAEFAARVCSAIVARAFGYDDRFEWTEKASAEGLLNNSLFLEEDMQQQYEELCCLIDEIGTKNEQHNFLTGMEW